MNPDNPTQPIDIARLPPVFGLEIAAAIHGVSKATVYRNPKKYGGKKIRGKGTWRFAKDTVLNIAGIHTGGRE